MNHRAYIANIECRVNTEGLLGVTGSHVQCTNGNISEMVQDSATVTTHN